MPTDFMSIDTSFPTFKEGEKADAKIAKLQNYLYMLLEQLRYTLNHLSAQNFNDAALQEMKDLLVGTVKANVVISNTVITNELYSEYGSIAKLTVDRLRTDYEKNQKYLDKDTSDENYQRIFDQFHEFVTAQTDGLDANKVQATNWDGELLYWMDTTYQAATTENTGIPVYIYAYSEAVKMRIGFRIEPSSGYYIPVIELGAGTGTGNHGKGFIYKGVSGLNFDYYSAITGELRRIVLGDNGITFTPYALQSLNFYSNGFSAQYSGEIVAYTWTKDASGRITQLTTDDGIQIPVTWNAGEM